MKNLVLIIHAGLRQNITDLLNSIDEVDGFTFTEVEGHGAQSKNNLELSERDKVVGYIPRLRIDLILDDKQIEAVLNAFQKNRNSEKKQNFYWITDVKQHGRF